MSDPTVLGLAPEASQPATDRSLPLSLPPRLVDTAVVLVLGLLYAGYVTGNVLTLHGWQPHLGRRRRRRADRPRLLLAAAPPVGAGDRLRGRYLRGPVGTVPVLVALYTAAPRLAVWRGLLAWSGTAAACIMVGSAVAQGSFGFYQVTSQAVSGVASAGMALALGLYTGIRRNYLARPDPARTRGPHRPLGELALPGRAGHPLR
jgi:hypothetical protein